jgi:hypothetical protein
MGIRSILAKPFAAYVAKETIAWSSAPAESQKKIFENLISTGSQTLFGKQHNFDSIKNYNDFKSQVPVRDYEDLKIYMEKIVKGERNVLWPGIPKYLSKTSGTTSGVKYIPLTKESIPNHINGARNAILSYIHETGKSSFSDKKLIFLSGSPQLDFTGKIPTGRLSGIVNHHVPSWLRGNQLPSIETNCIEDWEEKLERIIDETLAQPMSLISGIPPWVQMYFDRIHDRTQKLIKDVFPDFSLFIYGGVSFEPYRKKLFESIGKEIDSIETYPASEGFIAYQDSQNKSGLLLLLNSGIFFEFIPADEFFNEKPSRLMIDQIELNKNYAVVLSNNAGLWSYSLGDTVKFISDSPFRLVVTGRIKHFISAFGEHVIGEEVEKAMEHACSSQPGTEIIEFTVAPNVSPESGLPHHEWYIEFRSPPVDLSKFIYELNLRLQELNPYYDDLISGKILSNLKIISLRRDSFREYMRSIGKLGGQNKVPRLSNDRKIADELIKYAII